METTSLIVAIKDNTEAKQKVLDPCHRATGMRLSSTRGRQKLNFSREHKLTLIRRDVTGRH